LSPGVLNGTHRWLVRARLWRLILSQSTEGWWDASPNTAFVLEARATAETKQLPPTLVARVMRVLGSVTEAVVTEDIAGIGDTNEGALDDALASDGATTAHERSSMSGVDESVAPAEAVAESSRRVSMSPRRSAAMTRAAAISDCPLTCSVAAITGSLPRRLAHVRAQDASIAVSRVWTTMLCISMLERLNNSWIWGDGCVPERSPCMRTPAANLMLTRALFTLFCAAATCTPKMSAPSWTVRLAALRQLRAFVQTCTDTPHHVMATRRCA
jgi:hypothetical protein